MNAKGKYVPDPDLDDDGMDLGKYDNDPGFDEADDAGSDDERSRFEFYAESGDKPEDMNFNAAQRARYVAYLKEKGIDPAGFKSR